MRIKTISILLSIFFLLLLSLNSCENLIDVDLPSDQMSIESVFADSTTIESAVNALYADNFNSRSIFYELNFYLGVFSDDAYHNDPRFDIFNENMYTPESSVVSSYWNEAYGAIFLSNSLIIRLKEHSKLSDITNKQYLSEAKFFRAYCYFLLVNLFGDVPLVLDIDQTKTAMLPREKSEKIYELIISDLEFAEKWLNDEKRNKDNSVVTQSAVKALLARVYLYQKRWGDAVKKSSEVIDSPLHKLETLKDVFLRTSKETIFRMHNWLGDRYDGFTIYGGVYCHHRNGFNLLREELLNAFEDNDMRKTLWVQQPKGTEYFICDKYKQIRKPRNSALVEDHVFIRLAEMYLIRAEAYAQLGNINKSVEDLNIIRKRASLPDLSQSLSKEELIIAVAKEKQTEFFSEEAHRWFDLKRTGQIDAVLGVMKNKKWESYKALLPISNRELKYNKNLTANPGYGKI